MSNFFHSFKIKLAEPKRKIRQEYKKQGKVICGTVIEKDETFLVEIDLDNNGEKAPKILNFTPESFEVKDRLTVFTRTKDDSGRRTRIIRNKWDAKFHCGSTEQYIPFCNNWIVKGHIVKNGDIELFNFEDIVGIKGYVIVNNNYEE